MHRNVVGVDYILTSLIGDELLPRTEGSHGGSTPPHPNKIKGECYYNEAERIYPTYR